VAKKLMLWAARDRQGTVIDTVEPHQDEYGAKVWMSTTGGQRIALPGNPLGIPTDKPVRVVVRVVKAKGARHAK